MRVDVRHDAYVDGLFSTGTWRRNERVDVRRLFWGRIVDSASNDDDGRLKLRAQSIHKY